MSRPNMKQYEVVTSTVCKNIVETFVTITLLLKLLMILLKRGKV